MQRTNIMTWGFVLIFLGAQLAVVDSVLLTPRVSNFLSDQGRRTEGFAAAPAGINNPFSQAGFNASSGNNRSVANASSGLGGQQSISPPDWLCWPIRLLTLPRSG